MKQKFTFVILTLYAGKAQQFAVQIEDRNLGSATRAAIAKVATQEQLPLGAEARYEVVFACEGWPKSYTPQECADAAK